jgi:hypothetical protein
MFNAGYVIGQIGNPSRVILTYTEDPWDYVTTLEWDKEEGEQTAIAKLELTGFSWGYGGEGPRGLASVLAKIDTSKSFERHLAIVQQLDRGISGFTIFDKEKYEQG